MKTCNKCDKSFEHDFTFCPNCGTDSRSFKKKQPKPKKKFPLPSYMRKAWVMEKMDLYFFRFIIVVVFLFVIAAIREYNNKQAPTSDSETTSGYIDPTIPEIEALKKKLPKMTLALSAMNQLENGASPYFNRFGNGIYDKTVQNQLAIDNGNSTDAVVFLREWPSNVVYRHEYVRRGTKFTMTSIPNGIYYLQYYTGNHWKDDIKKTSKITGGFEYDESFTESSKQTDLITLEQDETSYSTFSVTLYKVSNGNFETHTVSPEALFK